MRKRLTKEELKDLYNDSWIYTMLLSTLIILIESLKTYTFGLFDVELTYSLLLLPLVFLITNYMNKKFGFFRTIRAIAISTIAMIAFVAIMYFVIGGKLNFQLISGQVFGYIASQIVNLFIYSFILNNTSTPWPLVLINYIFALIVFYLVYTVIQADIIIKVTFWKGYFITLAIQLIECIILTIIDKRIKKGLY